MQEAPRLGCGAASTAPESACGDDHRQHGSKRCPLEDGAPWRGLVPGALSLFLVDLLAWPRPVARLVGGAGDQTLFGRLSQAELVEDRAQEQQLAEQVEPGGEQEEQAELGAV